jgi:hypothetical protein
MFSNMMMIALPAAVLGYYGKATFYNNPNFAPGSCGFGFSDSEFIAALSGDMMPGYKAPNCNRMARVEYKGKSVTVKIVDTCPGCEKTSLNLSPVVFQALEHPDVGLIDIKWDFIDGQVDQKHNGNVNASNGNAKAKNRNYKAKNRYDKAKNRNDKAKNRNDKAKNRNDKAKNGTVRSNIWSGPPETASTTTFDESQPTEYQISMSSDLPRSLTASTTTFDESQPTEYQISMSSDLPRSLTASTTTFDESQPTEDQIIMSSDLPRSLTVSTSTSESTSNLPTESTSNLATEEQKDFDLPYSFGSINNKVMKMNPDMEEFDDSKAISFDAANCMLFIFLTFL